MNSEDADKEEKQYLVCFLSIGKEGLDLYPHNEIILLVPYSAALSLAQNLLMMVQGWFTLSASKLLCTCVRSIVSDSYDHFLDSFTYSALIWMPTA